MKKLVAISSLIGVSAMSLLGQGRVAFNNYVSLNAITVGSGVSPVIYAGADYSVQLLWAPGTYPDPAAFYAANPSGSAGFAFFGVTGPAPAHGPTVDGAGLFDGFIVEMGGPAGIYTMQVRGWFNGGHYPTFAAALSAGANTGVSQLFAMNATAPGDDAPNTIFPSFSMGVPEPSIVALAGLVAPCLLLVRRRQ